jgi:hypothetical protein
MSDFGSERNSGNDVEDEQQVVPFFKSPRKTYKRAERLTHEALDSLSIQDWEKCKRHTESIQSQDYEREVHRDAILEPIILTILPGDSDSSDDDTDNADD